jgi:hypothetical protein
VIHLNLSTNDRNMLGLVASSSLGVSRGEPWHSILWIWRSDDKDLAVLVVVALARARALLSSTRLGSFSRCISAEITKILSNEILHYTYLGVIGVIALFFISLCILSQPLVDV